MKTGIPWEDLPQELGFRSGMACWRRLQGWRVDCVWERLNLAILSESPRQARADRLVSSRYCGQPPAGEAISPG
ncbi:transposase [Burkholderia cenocepacia]|uniref:transposase n=1 Tax=Burkholderia cenocepacia TaxID=95486 RepID=UPI000F5801B7|nr:transposase [Burkholderia cenocepacia]RQU57678.1 transposase [Burkholderia cenocepacia]HDR9799386.1 transposase [Burkholderia cenocepacia]